MGDLRLKIGLRVTGACVRRVKALLLMYDPGFHTRCSSSPPEGDLWPAIVAELLWFQCHVSCSEPCFVLESFS